MKQIVLTAAVTPNVAGPVKLADPHQRLSQYTGALTRWRWIGGHVGYRIVLVETSGYGARRLLDRAGLSAENVAVDFEASQRQRAAGKGAVEAACIDYVANELDERDFLYKCTGRLYPVNAPRIIFPDVENSAIYVRRSYTAAWADTRLFGMSAKSWRRWFGGLDAEVDDSDSSFLEHCMGRRVHLAISENADLRRLPERPVWTGSSGSTGKKYGRALQRAWSPIARRAEPALLRILRDKQF